MPLALSVALATIAVVIITGAAGYLIDRSTGDGEGKPNG